MICDASMLVSHGSQLESYRLYHVQACKLSAGGCEPRHSDRRPACCSDVFEKGQYIRNTKQRIVETKLCSKYKIITCSTHICI